MGGTLYLPGPLGKKWGKIQGKNCFYKASRLHYILRNENNFTQKNVYISTLYLKTFWILPSLFVGTSIMSLAYAGVLE